jgi:hypothetical protein
MEKMVSENFDRFIILSSKEKGSENISQTSKHVEVALAAGTAAPQRPYFKSCAALL